MLAYAGKVLSQVAQPLALVAAFLFIALLLIHKKPKAAVWLVLISLLLVGVLGNVYFSTFLARSMEWRYVPPQETPKAGMIVLMAGGAEPAESPRQMVEVNGSADRILYAVRLFKAQAAPQILVTGGFEETAQVATLLTEFGVPADAILTQNKSLSIADDASFTGVLLTEKAVKDIILVTSAAMMDRAAFLFTREGFTVIPAPADYSVTAQTWETLMKWDPKAIALNLMPRADAFQRSVAILHEYAGLMYYRLKEVL